MPRQKQISVAVDVVSERVGHAEPAVTLNIHAHALPASKEGAAAALVDAAPRRALEE